MRLVRLAALAALSSLALSSTVAAAKNCWLPNEAQAAQVRGLHLMLMVGTLQCSKVNANSHALLNNFVELQRNTLMANADILKDHFIRENGMDGWQGASDTFETSMANLYSARIDDGGYCDSVDSFVRLASGASRPDLLLLAKSVADAPVGGLCTADDYSFTRPAGGGKVNGVDGVRIHRLPPKIALSDALPRLPVEATINAPVVSEFVAPTVIAVEPADTSATEVRLAKTEDIATPAVLVEEAAPVEVAAVVQDDMSADEDETPTKDDALNAAVLALQSAVTALQAVSTSAKPK